MSEFVGEFKKETGMCGYCDISNSEDNFGVQCYSDDYVHWLEVRLKKEVAQNSTSNNTASAQCLCEDCQVKSNCWVKNKNVIGCTLHYAQRT